MLAALAAATAPAVGMTDAAADRGPVARTSVEHRDAIEPDSPEARAAVVRTSPTIVQLDSPSASLPIAPPVGSPIAEVERDCGFSAALRDGTALWIFCDAALWSDGTLVQFVNNTASFATPQQPMVVHEHLDGAGEYQQFIRPVASYTPCSGGDHHFIWPMDATVVPAGEADRVFITFANLCGPTDGSLPTAKSVGLAEYRYQLGTPLKDLLATPTVARTITPRLFVPGEQPSVIFGEQIVTFGDHLYAYRCGFLESKGGCQVARAPITQAGTREAYRFWNGSTWAVQPSATDGWLATNGHLPLGGSHLHWLDQQHMFAMVWVNEALGWNEVRVMVADNPIGPWSQPMMVPLPADCHTTSSVCYSGSIHPQLGRPDEVVLSFMDTVVHFPTGRSPRGQVRAVSVPVGLVPTPPDNGRCWPWYLDVADPHPACDAIAWMTDAGLARGHPDGTFRPTDAITRQSAALIWHRNAGTPTQ